jgi:cysteine desulfurase
MTSTKRIYADHAATTPVREEVLAAMLPHFGQLGFNAGSAYAEGRSARAALDGARERAAALLGAKPREIVFTGGGSESDTLAILGAARAARATEAARSRGAHKTSAAHVITAATEHHAVLHAFDVLRDDGFAVTVLPVDRAGRVDPAGFAAALRPETVLVSLMLVNNELGTIHPVGELARVARARGIIVHTDAVQAPGRVALDVEALGVDLLSLSAHKFYGPKGVGLLYVRSGTPLVPLVVGGGQEHGLRAGTENVAGIAGLARALELAASELPREARRLRALRDRFETAVTGAVPGVRVNAAGAERAPNLSSLAFPEADAATLLVRLDLDGAAVSAGSACAAGSTATSHVLQALDVPDWVRRGTLRFSFGKLTSEEDVERLIMLVVAAAATPSVVRPEVGTSQSGSSRSLSEVRF